MYTAHFGFQFDPFEPGYRPERYFDAPHFVNSMERLRVAVEGGEKIIALSGPNGSGKTTLVKHFLMSWKSAVRILFLEGGAGTFEDVVDYLFTALDFENSAGATGEKLNEIYHYLRNAENSSCRTLLIIDNADKFPAIALKQISYLSQAAKTGNLQILFVGSSELKSRFGDSVLAPLRDQVRHWIRLANLTDGEVELFIDHCLKRAGYRGAKLFSSTAIESLIRHSAGNPRLIMTLCGFSLLSASIENREQVTGTMIDEVANDCIFETDTDQSEHPAGHRTRLHDANRIPLMRRAGNPETQQSSEQPLPSFDPIRGEAVLVRCRELGIPHPEIETSKSDFDRSAKRTCLEPEADGS